MSDIQRKFNDILIVGGGTAGWMSALYLRRKTRCRVVLVESAEVPTVGVGEATIPALVDYLNQLRIDEFEFMRRCHATYKLGIKFENWVEAGHEYWHPFGLCGGVIDGVDLFHFWVKARQAGQDLGAYSGYSLQATLANRYRIHRPIAGDAVVANYAFHLDAGALAHYLKEMAIAEGVEHLIESVQHVALDEAGVIGHVRTDSGRELRADIYVDCTGFRGLLIEQSLGDPYEDWSSLLLCDRAVTFAQPPDAQTPPFTRSTGAPAGWMWRIPLRNRVGYGYVYSSHHADDEEAFRQLVQHARLSDHSGVEPRYLDMRVGRRTEFWKRNCVAIGLSSGFIEPLESTGIFLIQRALEEFVECFPNARQSQALARVFNKRMESVYEETRDFVLLHYLLSRRDDTRFWRESRQVELPASMRARLELYDESGMVVENERNPVFRETNFYFIYAGGERLPRHPLGRVEFSNFPSVLQMMARIKSGNAKIVEQLPLHSEWLDWLHG